jgi:hypothetical protein
MQNLEDGWLLGGMTLARPEVIAEEQSQEVASRPEEPVTE